MNEEGRHAYLQNFRVQERTVALNEDQPKRYNAGKMNVNCQGCGEVRFTREPLNCY